MTNSLRFKLLLWHAAVLGTLVLGCSLWLLLTVDHVILREVDGRLRELAGELREVLTPDDEEKFYIALTEKLRRTFVTERFGEPYYLIWNRSGDVVDSSRPDLVIPKFLIAGTRYRGECREVVINGAADSWILVGQQTAPEQARFRELSTAVVLASVTALVLLLAGSWFLTGRALLPIARITKAAAEVSPTNRAARIDAELMESELADLAETINNAFDRLGQALEQQARFTAHASHELRTPLAIIRANTDLALSRERSPEDYRDTLITVRRAALRMEAVVSGLLTLARADAGRLALERDVVLLHEVLTETVDLCQPLADRRNIQLHVDVTPMQVMGDRNRLGEAIANLISNAVLYTPEGGEVHVQLQSESSWAVLQVQDTGPGIPDEDMQRIFEPFYRVHELNSVNSSGSGLGLAITRWIAGAHGGTITCRNGPERGSIFELRLPQASAAELRA